MTWVTGIFSGSLSWSSLESLPGGLHTKHSSCLIWGVHWAQMGDMARPYSGFYQMHQAGPSLRNSLLVSGSHTTIGDCSMVSCGSCFHPDMLFHCSIQNQRHSPSKLPSQSISVKFPREADDTDPRNEMPPSCCAPGFNGILVLLSFCLQPSWCPEILEGLSVVPA